MAGWSALLALKSFKGFSLQVVFKTKPITQQSIIFILSLAGSLSDFKLFGVVCTVSIIQTVCFHLLQIGGLLNFHVDNENASLQSDL